MKKTPLTRLSRKVFDAYERAWTRDHHASCSLWNEGVDCMHWDCHFADADYDTLTPSQRKGFLKDANQLLLGIDTTETLTALVNEDDVDAVMSYARKNWIFTGNYNGIIKFIKYV